eukprot:TRINITY_DN251_c1_g1_i1.p1 TRINITY_DN251_c1_g1~~TRINITY_DN251_c1_g1_i1.p1  ORF type:complete len:641 (-),score=93.24 TRINITY_DN251_c1_g1_i1:60-1982(-)
MSDDPQNKYENIIKVIKECYNKMAQVIIQSRVQCRNLRKQTKKSKWFNLETDDITSISEQLQHLSNNNILKNISIEIYFNQQHNPLAAYSLPDKHSILLERWRISYDPIANPVGAIEPATVYKRAVVLIRSLYSLLRILPSNRLSRRIHKTEPLESHISYTIHSQDSKSQFNNQVSEFKFGALTSPYGILTSSVQYRNTCDFDLKSPSVVINSKMIIPEYSPTQTVPGVSTGASTHPYPTTVTSAGATTNTLAPPVVPRSASSAPLEVNNNSVNNTINSYNNNNNNLNNTARLTNLGPGNGPLPLSSGLGLGLGPSMFKTPSSSPPAGLLSVSPAINKSPPFSVSDTLDSQRPTPPPPLVHPSPKSSRPHSVPHSKHRPTPSVTDPSLFMPSSISIPTQTNVNIINNNPLPISTTAPTSSGGGNSVPRMETLASHSSGSMPEKVNSRSDFDRNKYNTYSCRTRSKTSPISFDKLFNPPTKTSSIESEEQTHLSSSGILKLNGRASMMNGRSSLPRQRSGKLSVSPFRELPGTSEPFLPATQQDRMMSQRPSGSQFPFAFSEPPAFAISKTHDREGEIASFVTSCQSAPPLLLFETCSDSTHCLAHYFSELENLRSSLTGSHRSASQSPITGSPQDIFDHE